MLKVLPILALVTMVMVSGCVTETPEPGPAPPGELTEDEAFGALEEELDSLEEDTSDIEDELLGLLEQ